MKTWKLAVVGSRDFNDAPFLFKKLDENIDRIEMIISGGCRGVDELSRQWAEKRGKAILIFYPRWYDEKGNFLKGAGFMRNKLIVDACDYLLALRINQSKGTTHSIELAKKAGKPSYVYDFVK